jgi:hypothetical protein
VASVRPDELLLDGGPSGYADVQVVDDEEAPIPKPKLRRATEEKIREALRAVHTLCIEAGQAAPNVNQIPPLTQRWLEDRGFKATWRGIQKVANEDEFTAQRGEIGSGKRKDPPQK